MRVMYLIILVFFAGTMKMVGQVRCEAYLPSFFIDVDAMGGVTGQQIKSVPLTMNYPGIVDPAIGKLTMNNGASAGLDVRCGYYINRNKTIGIGASVMVSKQTSTLGLDTFHAEFSATDFKGSVFRQVVSSDHPITEDINRSSINIPILFLYKKDISDKLFFTADGGIVYNIQLQNTWSSNANFDYEAIYKFTGTGSDVGTVYDNSPVPGSTDLLITKNQFLKNNPTGDVNGYFSTKNQAGYSVGLNENLNKKSGSFKLASGSLGYTADVALNFKITRKIFFKLGAYYMAQTFSNTSQNNSLLLTSKIIRNSSGQDIGVDYNSLMNSVKTIQSDTYGITIGIKIFLSNCSLWDFE